MEKNIAKTRQINFRLSETSWQRLHEEAPKYGMTPSDFIRYAIEKELDARLYHPWPFDEEKKRNRKK